MKYSTVSALTAVAASLFFQGCRTTQEILRDYDTNFAAGAYAPASVEVTELAEKQDSEECLWRLSSGAAKMFAGETGAALEQFDRTEVTFEKSDA